MAMTNKQLAERARDLGRQLERDVETSGLNKEDLTHLVARLEEEAGVAPEEDPEDITVDPEEVEVDSVESPESADQSKPKRRSPRKTKAAHYVTKGHAVQSPRGQLRELEDVFDTDFEPEVLQILIKKGCVKKRG